MVVAVRDKGGAGAESILTFVRRYWAKVAAEKPALHATVTIVFGRAVCGVRLSPLFGGAAYGACL